MGSTVNHALSPLPSTAAIQHRRRRSTVLSVRADNGYSGGCTYFSTAWGAVTRATAANVSRRDSLDRDGGEQESKDDLAQRDVHGETIGRCLKEQKLRSRFALSDGPYLYY